MGIIDVVFVREDIRFFNFDIMLSNIWKLNLEFLI
jgi:hypothetical protein